MNLECFLQRKNLQSFFKFKKVSIRVVICMYVRTSNSTMYVGTLQNLLYSLRDDRGRLLFIVISVSIIPTKKQLNKNLLCTYIQVKGKVVDSTLQTYITHFRYALQYIATITGKEDQCSEIDTLLRRKAKYYRRNHKKGTMNKTWQHLDSRNRWIHW